MLGGVGGLLGGAAAGFLGGAFGRCIEEMAPPPLESVLPDGLHGAIVWGAVAAAAGLGGGVFAGRLRGGRAPFLWMCFSGFLAVLVAAVETAQAGAWSAARAFAVSLVLLLFLCAGGPWILRGLWRVRWLFVAWLAVCAVGEMYARLRPPAFTPVTSFPQEPVVLLHAAPLPSVLGHIAVHHAFLTYAPEEGRWHRWEVWQYPHGCPTSWGHVHVDLLRLESDVGGGPGWIDREWRGDEAKALIAALARSREYPHQNRYLAWPGPNSATYLAWVFRSSGVPMDLDPRSIGRDYLGRMGAGGTTTGTGVQVQTPLLGLKAGLDDGVEVHFLGFTFGVDVWTPALKTPLGRFGFPE
jgi:hypothetical protein